MDINKQKLKNRLNVKFQPFRVHQHSQKRLNIPDHHPKESQNNNKEISLLENSKNRSISQMRLPSLEKKVNISRMVEEKTEEIINVRQMKQRINSIKQLPSIKVESKEPVDNTLTFLMKNQILNIPKIVALLMKTQSEQFLYMRVKGIYEFEVCSEAQKGMNYITVSKNGMVREGELIPLQKLVYQYGIFNKLKKIHFYKNFVLIRFMNKWKIGFKHAKFYENKLKIRKVFEQNQNILKWKIELKNILYIPEMNGNLTSGWVLNVSEQIKKNKDIVEKRLLFIVNKLLQKFQLPISENFDLMNKVLMNLSNLSLNFEKKFRIERCLEMTYQLGRMLEFYQLQSIGYFIVNHLDQIAKKFRDKNQIYIANILAPIESLDITKNSYSTEKERILLTTTFNEQVNFKMIFNDKNRFQVQPSIESIVKKVQKDIKQFIAMIQKINYKIIKTQKFNFILKNIIKDDTEHAGQSNKDLTIKQYVYSINLYFEKLKELDEEAQIIRHTIERKIELLEPFYRIYIKYQNKIKEEALIQFSYFQMEEELQHIQADKQYVNVKLHDGEYFLFGYMSHLEIKEEINDIIKKYQEMLINSIPGKIRHNKQQFMTNILKNLQILRIVIKNPDQFIKVSTECEDLQEKIADYSSKLNEIQQLQDLYLRIKKIQTNSLVQQKSVLTQIKMKLKNYKETKENSYLFYKKQVQNMKKQLVHRIDSIIPHEMYYEINTNYEEMYINCAENNKKLIQLAGELKHLNQLEAFFDIRTTSIPKLQTLLLKFQSLEEIWLIRTLYQKNIEEIFEVNIMKIMGLPLIKKFEAFLRKVQSYKKDPDYYKISINLLQKIPVLLNTIYMIVDLQNQILRPKDFDEITSILNKEYKVEEHILTYNFSVMYDHKMYEIRQQILQISFKSHKQQQILRLLKQFEDWWKQIRLQGEYLDEYPLIIIFNDNDQLRKEIQEYSLVLLNIINHKYGTFARKQCNKYLRNIGYLAELLQLAILHQEKFLALFPILTSKYAEKQIPSQYKKFHSVIEKTMKNVKWLIKPTENLNENTRSLLNNHIKQFDAISKALAHFLQKKRVKFQRFYFLQDDELLQVLVGISGESTIFRMFDGIKGWLNDAQGIKYGVQGIGGEHLNLKGWSYKHQEPEVIFKSLQDSIKTNLNSIVRSILHNYEVQMKQLKNLYPKMPWMCIYTVQLILFTKQMQINCFQNGININLQISLINENIKSSVANALQNSNYITLQLFLMHFAEQLRHENVNNVFDFKWYSFLRYYMEKDVVIMKSMGSEHIWGGEYQGLWNLMINTSDIRRAHTSILINIKHCNGVLLQGPSGTGKTQSLKQLARCMAKYCVIFNCSSEVNIRTLQKLLSGLCYTGSWICLDEINRLTAEIMSVVANQINSIKNAVVQNKEVFSFMGKDLKLKKGVGIFSTMNPIYLKRAKLTQNLKSFFRIISVNVPDYEKILQVMLYSLGIASSSKYSHQISVLFKSLSIQLSLRSQYDFGLRAMKTFILNLSMIKASVKNDEEGILEALYKTFYSRLEQTDKETFFKVINDVFNKSIQEKEKDYKLSIMKEAPQTGIIVLGPTSTKTTIIKRFLQLYDKEHLHLQTFNPNSLELKYFLGQSMIGKWQQGIVQKMAKGSFQNKNENYILVLDCRLKSETIQNFNTLLDDSKMLSLSNGTRLKIYNNFKLIMQTPDLQMTSPATITRCNVVYVNQEDITKEEVIKNYLPIFNNKQIHHKIVQMLNQFTITDIHKIINIANLIFFKKINKLDQLTLSEAIGLEKSLIFSIQLLGLQSKIKRFMNKDNAIPAKKNIFNFYLQFNKYQEGELIQLDSYVNQINLLNQTYIYTIKDRFYEYINTKAYNNEQNVLWKGQRMIGKTSAIKYSIESIFKKMPQNKNILKLSINSYISSKIATGLIDQKVIHNEQVLDEKKVIIYIDDIHLANEEISEFIRYTSQYKKIFNYRSKELAKLVRHTLIADANNDYGKDFVSRFSRHFAQINFQIHEDYIVRSIFTTYSKHMINVSKAPADIKVSIEVQLQKIVQFLSEYIKINNFNYREAYQDGTATKQSLSYLSFCHLLPILRNFSILNPTICKQIPDLITFLFSEIRSQQIQHRFCSKQIDFIKLAYTETFKHKYQKQYEKTLKSLTGYPNESVKYTNLKGQMQIIQNWQQFKNQLTGKLKEKYYVSQFILVEIMKFLRVLEWNTGNYYLVGNPGLGKRTMLKIGVSLSKKEFIDVLPVQERKIMQWYFNLIKSSFEYNKQYAVIMDLDSPLNELTLRYLQKIQNGYPILELITNENCQYCYNCISEYKEVNYEKYSKPYNEVIEDFIKISKKKIQFLFFSDKKSLANFHLDYHYLYQQTYLRIIEEFPSESILQISNQILQQNLSDQVDKRGLTNIFLRLYKDLIELMKQNETNNKNYFKYNVFYHFKVINNFIKNYKLALQKAKHKEDILNRSIHKVHEIAEILEKLKHQIKQMQPKVKEKTEKLLEVVPILQKKKKISQQVKILVINEKKQLQEKNNEIQEMVKQVQQKIKNAQTILQEANDSVQTIKRSQLSELRNNANPHPLIKFTLQNMVIILGQNSQSWENIKKVLSDTSLMPKLKSAVLTLPNMHKLRKRINQNPDWNFDSVSKISFGVRYMVRWIKRSLNFHELKYSLENERQKVEDYKKELIKSQEKLASKQRQLDVKESQVKIVEDQYIFYKNELKEIQELMSINNKKFQNAEIIKNHLHDQINNWYDQVSLYKTLKKNCQSNALKITFYLQVYTSLIVEEQKKINTLLREYFQKYGFNSDASFNCLDFIKENIIMKSDMDDKNYPLSLENLSIQDGKNVHIIQTLYHLKERPILLDPDNQALNWIQRQLANEPQNGMKVIITKQSFVSSLKNVELAMRQGYILVLLIENEIDQFTQSILSSKVTETSGSKIIQFNKNILTINQNFRLLMCNKSRNPNLSNNLYINHTVLNFQITKSILKSMLLHELIMIENKESYVIQQELQIQKKTNQKIIREIQEQIIQSLINSKKNLIDNVEFIQLLGTSQLKRSLLKIYESQSKQKNYVIKKIHDEFQNVTESISQLYLSLKYLNQLNHILSWNSQIFVQYFIQAAISSISTPIFEEDDDEQVEVRQLKQSNFEFDHYSLSLGNSRPTSALSFVSGVTSKVVVQERKDDFQEEHPTSIYSFQNLIGHKEMVSDQTKKGTMSQQRQITIRNQMINYIKSAFSQNQRIIWGLIMCLMDYDLKDLKILFELKAKRNKLKQYLDAGQLPDRLSNYLKVNSDKSQQNLVTMFNSSNPFSKFGQSLPETQILLLCKLICPHLFHELCMVLIRSKGLSQILKYSETKTSDWFQRSDNIHPILLIMGQDPITRISDYLTKKKYKNVILIPMGQGQNKVAEIVLEKQSKRQNLVIIHNLQISQNFLLFLSKMLQQFQIKPPHPNFRLILVSTVFDQLNEQITSYCHKYLIQQPMGVKNQIKYLRQINDIPLVHPYHKKLEFVLTYMHSILNNLSKFKPYGWNIKYDFHTAQFFKSIVSLKEIVESPLNLQNYECNIDLQQEKTKTTLDDTIDFKALRYIIGDIGYIGKLSDDIDRTKMTIIVNKFINPIILEKNNNDEGIKSIDFSKIQLSKIASMIQQIDQRNSEIFGLNKNIKPLSQNASIITSTLQRVYYDNKQNKEDSTSKYKKPIAPISHKFQFINKEIQKFNYAIEMIKIYGENYNLLEKIKNGYLLATITPMSKIYHLKAFYNPRQFFIAIIKDVAHKHNVVYDKVELVWSVVPKDNISGCYGISNLNLEGAALHGNTLQDGVQQKNVTLFVQGIVKKKEKQTRKLVSIPLYLEQERQGQINSYGHNTNLLTRVKLEASHPEQFWILRSTAFIVG